MVGKTNVLMVCDRIKSLDFTVTGLALEQWCDWTWLILSFSL